MLSQTEVHIYANPFPWGLSKAWALSRQTHLFAIPFPVDSPKTGPEQISEAP